MEGVRVGRVKRHVLRVTVLRHVECTCCSDRARRPDRCVGIVNGVVKDCITWPTLCRGAARVTQGIECLV